MAISTSDNEDFVPSPLGAVEDKPREEAIKLRLLPQGAGSRLDSDTIRGEVPTNNMFNKNDGDVISRLLVLLYGN